MAHPVRVVRAVVSTGGTWLGALAPFPVDSPWWADVELVTGRLDELLGVPATVLRLVDVVGGVAPAGGLVTYHVEVPARPAVDPGWQYVDPDELAAIASPKPDAARQAGWTGGPPAVGRRGAREDRSPSDRFPGPGEDLEPLLRVPDPDVSRGGMAEVRQPVAVA